MARRSPSLATLRALLARSGNRCTLPGCTQVLINENSTLVGEVAHIEAAEAGGPRFNPHSSDNERRAEANLILLCRRHHTEVDAESERFTVPALRRIKADHESRNGEKLFKLDESLLFKIQAEMETYWTELKRAHHEDHVVPNLAVPLDTAESFGDVLAGAHAALTSIRETSLHIQEREEGGESELHALLKRVGVDPTVLASVPYYENPFVNRHWESTALALPNFATAVSAALHQLEVLYYQEYLSTHPSDRAAAERLTKAKAQLVTVATRWGLAD